MIPTPYDDVNNILEDVQRSLAGTLSGNLTGIYVYGSLIMGDFDIRVSDIDLLVVTRAHLEQAVVHGLRDLHAALVATYPSWNDRIECAYVPEAALKTFKRQTSVIYVISPGEPLHAKRAGKDWLMNWYIVREYAWTLLGPDPRTIIEPVSLQEYRDCVRTYLRLFPARLAENHRRGFQAYAIITACRGVYTVMAGEVASKQRGAEWAMATFPEWQSFIASALRWRQDRPRNHDDDEVSYPQTQRFIEFMLKQLAER